MAIINGGDHNKSYKKYTNWKKVLIDSSILIGLGIIFIFFGSTYPIGPLKGVIILLGQVSLIFGILNATLRLR